MWEPKVYNEYIYDSKRGEDTDCFGEMVIFYEQCCAVQSRV